MSTVLVAAKHGRFHVNPNDTVVGASLRSYGEFAEHELMLLKHFLRPGDTVIDVGTHSVFFATAVGAAGRVIAIEAQAVVHALLAQNLALNGCVNVVAYHAACGAADGMLTLPPIDYTRAGNFGAFSFRIHDIARYLPIAEDRAPSEVSVLPIDSLNLEACRLLKIDAEGMEAEIVDGARRTIEAFLPILYVENNQRDSSPDLIRRFEALGYDAYWHVVSYFRAGNFAQSTENIFPAPLELNLLCVPAGQEGPAAALPRVAGPHHWLPDEIGTGRYDADELLLIAEMFDSGP